MNKPTIKMTTTLQIATLMVMILLLKEGDDGNGDNSGIDARDGHSGNEDGSSEGMDDDHGDEDGHDDGMDDHDDDHDDGMDHDDDSDGVSWEPYHGGYCKWEGNP